MECPEYTPSDKQFGVPSNVNPSEIIAKDICAAKDLDKRLSGASTPDFGG
jgi:hypothetical protein